MVVGLTEPASAPSPVPRPRERPVRDLSLWTLLPKPVPRSRTGVIPLAGRGDLDVL